MAYTPFTLFQPLTASGTKAVSAADIDAAFDSVANPSVVSSPTKRSLAERFDDTLNIRDFGAVLDGVTDCRPAFIAAFQQIAVSGKTSLRLMIPAGQCRISAPVSALLPVGMSLSIHGAGSGTSQIVVTSGADALNITLSLRSGLSISDLGFLKTAAGATGTALTINSTAGQTACGPVMLNNLSVTGSTPLTNGWAIGLSLRNLVNPQITNYSAVFPGAAVPGQGQGVGILVTGDSPLSYATDHQIANMFQQGGAVGLRLSGYYQGIYLANHCLIGLDYGVLSTEPVSSFVENITITNGHINAAVNAIKLAGLGWLQVSNNLLLRFNAGQSPWDAISVIDCNNMCISGNNVYGGNANVESAFRLTTSTPGIAAAPSAITGNSIANIAGAGIVINGYLMVCVVGNSGNGVFGGFVSDSNPGKNMVAANQVNGVYDVTSNFATNTFQVNMNLLVAGTTTHYGSITPSQPATLSCGTLASPWDTVSSNTMYLGKGGVRASLSSDDAGGMLIYPTTLRIANLNYYANDAAAALAGIPLFGLYINATGGVQQRRT